MNNKKISTICSAIFLLNLFIIFGGAGCSGQSQPVDAGIWSSTNGGADWKKRGAIFGSQTSLNNQNARRIFSGPVFTEGEIKKFDALLQLVPEPSEEEIATLKNPVKTFYLSTYSAGLWTSNNEMENWKKLNSDSNIGEIAPDPKNRNTIYFSEGPTIFKSLDQGRNWEKIHQAVGDIKSLVVDYYKTDIVYAGTAQGFIYKSEDAGVSWKIVFQDPNSREIKQMFMDPFDSRIIYTVINNGGIQVTQDSGKTWKFIIDIPVGKNPTVEQHTLIDKLNRAQTFAFSFTKDEKMIVAASTIAFLQSKDAGKTWKEIKLITPFSPIQFMLIDYKDHNKIYYIFGGNNLLYKTDNGGDTWYNLKLPIGAYKFVTDFQMDPLDSSIIYMTLLENKPKKSIIPEVQF